jgi:hypothetical protein
MDGLPPYRPRLWNPVGEGVRLEPRRHARGESGGGAARGEPARNIHPRGPLGPALASRHPLARHPRARAGERARALDRRRTVSPHDRQASRCHLRARSTPLAEGTRARRASLGSAVGRRRSLPHRKAHGGIRDVRCGSGHLRACQPRRAGLGARVSGGRRPQAGMLPRTDGARSSRGEAHAAGRGADRPSRRAARRCRRRRWQCLLCRMRNRFGRRVQPRSRDEHRAWPRAA